jgi:hypothetical protein
LELVVVVVEVSYIQLDSSGMQEQQILVEVEVLDKMVHQHLLVVWWFRNRYYKI